MVRTKQTSRISVEGKAPRKTRPAARASPDSDPTEDLLLVRQPVDTTEREVKTRPPPTKSSRPAPTKAPVASLPAKRPSPTKSSVASRPLPTKSSRPAPTKAAVPAKRLTPTKSSRPAPTKAAAPAKRPSPKKRLTPTAVRPVKRLTPTKAAPRPVKRLTPTTRTKKACPIVVIPSVPVSSLRSCVYPYVLEDLAAALGSIPPVFWGDGIPPGKRSDSTGAKSATVAELRDLHKLVTGSNPPSLKKDALVAFVRSVVETVTTTGEAPTANPKRVTKFDEIEYIPYRGTTLSGAALRETLDRDGMAVVPLPEFKTSWLEDYQLWLEDFAEKQTQERAEYGDDTPVYDREDPTTWLNKNIPASTRGIFKQWLAHTPFQWEIREACASIFADIYECAPADLITSYDGGSVTFPDRRPCGKSKFPAWFHNDQPRTMPDFQCWQGVVYLTPSGERDPGTVAYAGSKDIWAQYNELRPSEGHKWGMMDTELVEELLTESVGEARIVRYEVPQFHMFIFNSRVAHCSYPGMPGCDPRFATYVSMVPRSYLSEAELAKKRKYYEENKMTSHWSFGPYFSANGGVRIYNARKPVIPESPHLEKLTPLMERLAGY